MEQHPVPQHIASFKFKLFGNLTVRQFVTLAIPLSLAALIYFSPLPAIIRLPIAAILGLLGMVAALVPIGGMPLDKWLVLLTRAILAPTQRIWTKEAKIPQFLSIVTSLPAPPQDQIVEPSTAQSRERLRQYLRSLPKGEVSPLDVKERLTIQRLDLGEGWPYETQPVTTEKGSPPAPIIWPTSDSLPQIEPVPAAARPQISPSAKPFALPGLEKRLGKALPSEPLGLVKTQLASEANGAIENIIPIQTPNNKIRLIHSIGKTRARKLHFAPPAGFDLSKLPIRGERRFEISQELKRRFAATENNLLFTAAALFQEANRQGQPARQAFSANIAPEPKPSLPKSRLTQPSKTKRVPEPDRFVPTPKITTAARADVSLKVTQPQPQDTSISIGAQPKTSPAPAQSELARAQIVPLTTTANVISGVVASAQGEGLENIILVIKDSNGIPVRALKTNKLGQFLSATPLSSGTYSIEIESSLYKFAPVSLNLENEVLSPLQIKAES